MSENVFVGADSFRRLLLGAAGGYELQGHHEAAETVLRVIGTLDELTTGGKGRDRADEDQEAMAAAETVRLYCEKRRKTGCCGNYALQLNRPPQSWCYVVGPSECHKELQEQVKATLGRLYPKKKISDILPKPEILGQLAEELAEASAAASKLRRKIDGKNPTPKTLEECWEDLKKEIGDVMNSIDALTEQDPQNYHEFMSECGEYAEPKMERWLYRLTEQEGKP